ncbi:MAG: LD-carboxypeptidase [Calditrichia bacterium]
MNSKGNPSIGICCPAGPVDKIQIEPALRELRKLGYHISLGKHLFKRDGYLAGSVQERWEDFKTFWEDSSVDVIWTARGGFGSAQLLPFLEELNVPLNTKLLIGFSDITALQMGLLEKCQLPSLSGFTLTSQLHAGNPYVKLADKFIRRELTDLTFTGGTLSGPVEAVKGVFLGGTLSVLVSLVGTSFLPKPADIILFLEDVNEPLYKIERYLLQLKLAGFLERVRAVLLGTFLYEHQPLDVEELFKKYIPDNAPVLTGLPYGHYADSIALPNGVPATFYPEEKRLAWKWSGPSASL